MHLVSLVVFLFVFAGVTPALATTDTFYGQQSLNPLVDGDKMTIALPGGAKAERWGDNQATYVVADHLGSNRVAMAKNNAISGSIDYTPFGDSLSTDEIKVTGHYTGQVFEPETATYDYHARSYDPSVGRFTSVDAIRQSISPYSYTEGNPINYTDPNGLGKVNFWLVSEKNGTDMAYASAMVANVFAASDKNKVIMNQYDTPRSIRHPLLDQLDARIGNITIDLNTPALLSKFGQEVGPSSRVEVATKFARYFKSRLLLKHAPAIEQVESIVLNGCNLACGGGGEESFAVTLADKLRNYEGFTNLKHIYASNYDIKVSFIPDSRSVNFDVTSRRGHSKLSFKVGATDYYSGNLPPILTDPLKVTGVKNQFELFLRTPGGPNEYGVQITSERGMRSNIQERFSEPIFSKIIPQPSMAASRLKYVHPPTVPLPLPPEEPGYATVIPPEMRVWNYVHTNVGEYDAI